MSTITPPKIRGVYLLSTKTVPKNAYRFGPYELDLACYELRKRDRRLRLSASSMELLQVFVSRSGELVTREEIADRLWREPETVDVTHGINTAVNRLRNVLGDDSASPIYIETVVGKGYRFIAKVVQADESAEQPKAIPAQSNGTIVEPAPPPLAKAASEAGLAPPALHNGEKAGATISNPRRTWALLAACLLLAGAGALFWNGHQKTRETASSATLAGNIQFLQATFNGGDPITSAAMSHDGRTIAYGDQSGVSVRAVGTGLDRVLPSPRSFRSARLAWFPGDTALLLSGTQSTTEKAQVWVVSLNSQAPRLMFEDAGEAVASPSGSQIAYTRHGNTEIWVADARGKNSRKLIAAAADADTFSSLLWAEPGNRLTYVTRRTSAQPTPEVSPLVELQSQFQWNYQSIDSATGKLLASERNVRFDSAYLLKDGHFFFPHNEFVHEHPLSRLFTVRTDLQTGRFLAAPRSVLTFDGDSASNLSASDNGQELAVVIERRSPDVWIGELRQPGPKLVNVRRFTYHATDTYPHAWTPDSSAVLYESFDLGKFAIYKRKLDGSAPEVLARLPDHCVLPQVTPDGKWILFAEFSYPSKVHLDAIFRVSAKGGKPEQVPTQGPFDEFQCPVSNRGNCVIRETIGKQFVYFALDPLEGKGKELGRTDLMPNILGDWGLSPDSTMVALANHDPAHPAIRIVTLSSPSKLPAIEVPVRGFGTVLEPTWSTDGRGFYVECKIDIGYSLLYVDRSGRATVLRETPNPIWGVPSRDGKKLAFVDQSASNNVWIGYISVP